ncbi:MAG: hypothetical protein GX246_07020 [Clostridiales bacterium]|nr:hypothetical protein [Bacillota bacterium]NLL54883.1 hypothetical protein [Clostridiales bacterium]
MKGKQKRKAKVFFLIVFFALLAGGIALASMTRTVGAYPVREDEWKLTLGAILACCGGFGLIGMLVFAVQRGVLAGTIPSLKALSKGQLTQAQYAAIQKKEIIFLVIMALLAAVMLAFWHNSVSIMLALCMVLGAAGSLILLRRGKGSLITLVLAAGGIVGILAAASTKVDRSKRYAYFLNGIKIGEGDGSIGNTLSTLFGGVIFVGALALGIAYGITWVCLITTGNQ